MTVLTVVTAQGEAKVRRLGLFEIDDIPKDIPPPYTYTVHLFGGDEYDLPYDLDDALLDPPQEPETPLSGALEGSPDHYAWQEWLRFQAALAHQSKIFEAYAAYCERVAHYIAENCVSEVDIKLLDETEWGEIYQAALCPQVTYEDVKLAMSQNFGAKWGGKEVFEALASLEGGHGEYIATKVWETDLMIRLGEQEAVYTERSVKERARMIAALKIPELFKVLESDRQLKEMEKARRHG